MKVISLINMKGGVGKTTMAVNICHCLSTRESKKVLMIDVDPQFNATQCVFKPDAYVKYLEKGGDTIINVFDEDNTVIAGTVDGIKRKETKDLIDIKPYKINDNWYVLPGNLNLYQIDMPSGSGKENSIKRYLEEIQPSYNFDYVIIDTPPTPSVWMSSALIASDYYLIPVKPDPLSYTGIDLLEGIVKKRKRSFNLKIKCIGIIFTMADKNTLVYRGAIEYINKTRKSELKFKNDITQRTVIARGITKQDYILDVGNDASKKELLLVVKELIKRIEEDGKKDR